MSKSLAVAYAMKKRVKKEGKDESKGVHKDFMAPTGGGLGQSYAGDQSRWAQAERYSGNERSAKKHESVAKLEHQNVLESLKAMKKPQLQGLAEGGEVDNSDGEDLVARIMTKMSKGGQVANESEPEADSMPAEFDDLALRDDLESHYGDDDNSGDELGNAQEDEDRKDIVSRIMSSRRKKDRNPRPA